VWSVYTVARGPVVRFTHPFRCRHRRRIDQLCSPGAHPVEPAPFDAQSVLDGPSLPVTRRPGFDQVVL